MLTVRLDEMELNVTFTAAACFVSFLDVKH